MPTQYAEISVNGKTLKVPAVSIDRRTVVATGKGLRIARFHEEEWNEDRTITDPDSFLRELKGGPLRADIFTFAQPLADPQPRHPFHVEWDDVAAVSITTYSDWWDQLPQVSRKNVRRAERRGVVVRLAVFDDVFVRGIKGIYDETPIRQGRHFWHYGKDLESVKRENATFLDRCDFVAAYHNDELIGFIKIVYVGKVARIMQIISKNAHADKRPPNILLAKAMEVCCQKGMTHFVYGQYFYGSKGHTPITEFKHRNGFKRIPFPRYFVPLTLKGKAAIALGLHRGVKSLIPPRLLNFLLETRARLNRKSPEPAASTSDEA